MPYYDFNCFKCRKTFSIQFGMNDDEKRKNAKCPDCKGKVERIFSSPAAIIKGTLGSDFKLTPNQSFIDCDGRPVKLNFIDHGKDNGLPAGSMANRMPGARYDEKSGRAVVDVCSDQPDPLGRLQKTKQKSMEKGWSQMRKKNIGTKVKRRR
jgi:putative FmdB family regulatory protein